MSETLIAQLQRSAMEDGSALTSVLRKALVVASKLGVEDFQQWCRYEINGYYDVVEDDHPIPSYRWITGRLEVRDPFGRHQPVLGLHHEISQKLCRRAVDQPVSSLEDILADSNDGSRIHIPLQPKALDLVFGDEEWYRAGMIPQLGIQKNQLAGILESVRAKVLSWSLDLEQLGIKGEGMSFSQEESKAAQSHNYTVNGNTGDVTFVLGNSVGGDIVTGRNKRTSSQDGLTDAISKITDLVQDLRPALSPERQEQVSRDYDAFVTEISSSNPRESWYTVTGEGLMEAAHAVTTFPAQVLKEYIEVACTAAKLKTTGQ